MKHALLRLGPSATLLSPYFPSLRFSPRSLTHSPSSLQTGCSNHTSYRRLLTSPIIDALSLPLTHEYSLPPSPSVPFLFHASFPVPSSMVACTFIDFFVKRLKHQTWPRTVSLSIWLAERLEVWGEKKYREDILAHVFNFYFYCNWSHWKLL